MAELLKTEITRKELEEGVIPTNYVLCEVYYHSEGAKTKSGIIYGINTDVLYGSLDNPNDTSSHPADMAEVSMICYKCPEKLYYNPEDRESSMPWDCDMELQEGDLVFTNIIEALNAVTLRCEGKDYKLIPYQDIYCAKREVFVDKWSVPQKKKTIVEMINGYILCTQLNKESLSELDVTSEDKIDNTKGKVAFIGNPVKSYLNPDFCDIPDIRVGDVVLFDKKYKPFLLERQKYASKFSEDTLYFVVQRRRINAVLSREA